MASGVNLANYDSLGEGVVDSLAVLYAGQTQYLGDLWPHNSVIDLRFGTTRTNLYVVAAAGRNADDLSIGTFCHEAGHLLFRFPDLYDYGNRDGDGVESAGIGMYCLMGAGSHADRGRTPSAVCGYLRELAGWTQTVTLNAGGAFEAKHGDYGTVHKFETGTLNEYFIVENRSKMDLDRGLPASGLSVLHCDTRGSNEWQEGSSTRHYQAALLQADGNRDLERNANQGDGGDLYGPVAGVALSHATRPSSRLWNGAESGLTVSAITPPGPIIQFAVGEVAPAAGPVHGEAAPNLAIPDRNPTGVSSTIALAAAGVVGKLTVQVTIRHTWRGDLRVELFSPAGRRALLVNQAGGSADDIVETYTSDAPSPLANLVGEGITGNWVLRVSDLAARDVGTLQKWSLDAVPR